MLLMILRVVLGMIVFAVAILPGIATFFLVREGLSPEEGPAGWMPSPEFASAVETATATGAWAGGAVAWIGLLAVDAALVWLGGMMLVRFDVARDKGA
jgi:hypothetical protein